MMSEIENSASFEADFEIPFWLNAEFIEKHLQNYYGSHELKVGNFEVSSATAKGENFASSIYRVKVEFNTDVTERLKTITKSIIVKVALSSGIAFECLSSHNVFNKEIEFYGKIVPKIKTLLNQLNEPNELIADTFGVCTINKVMLFDDLTPKGYGMASIQQGFNLSEAKFILKKLATFHGICAVLQEQQPNIFENYKHGAMSRDSGVFHNFYFTQLDVIIEVTSKWPNYDRYTEKLRRLRNDVVERGCQMFDPNPSHFNTLNHGDFWLNNVMIKPGVGYIGDDAPFENVIFIDFQDSCWASPSIDLHYLLSTSLCEELRPKSFIELIDFYHKQLSSILSRLEYKQHIPTNKEFLDQFNARHFYGFIAACTIQPFMINESTEDADLEAMVLVDERSMRYRRNMYQQPKVQANLHKLIPIYDELGIFD